MNTSDNDKKPNVRIKNTKRKGNKNKPFAEDDFDLININEERERKASTKQRDKKKKTIKLINIQILFSIIAVIAMIFMLYTTLMKTATIKYISATTSQLTETIVNQEPSYSDNKNDNKTNDISELDEPEITEFNLINMENKTGIFEIIEISNETINSEAQEVETIKNDTPLESILELQEIFENEEIIGYLKIDGTNILYPVTQSENNDFYLEHDIYKNENNAGSLFMDFENDIFELDKNTIIYGHNMKDGTMFHNLRFYIDPQYYSTHKYIELTTLYEETKWEIFSFYETDTEFNYLKTGFENDEIYRDFLQEIVDKSLYQTSCEISFEDKILTLSTCTNTEDTRYVLTSKLVNEDNNEIH